LADDTLDCAPNEPFLVKNRDSDGDVAIEVGVTSNGSCSRIHAFPQLSQKIYRLFAQGMSERRDCNSEQIFTDQVASRWAFQESQLYDLKALLN
jgi:hypothetical protein